MWRSYRSVSSTRSATRSAMPSDAVSPGESMPAACTRRGCRRSRRIPPVPDGTPAVVSGLVAGAFVEVPANLALVDWDQPARFRRLSDGFGPWGLVLLEAIVIRADHAVSAGADVELEPGR